MKLPNASNSTLERRIWRIGHLRQALLEAHRFGQRRAAHFDLWSGISCASVSYVLESWKANSTGLYRAKREMLIPFSSEDHPATSWYVWRAYRTLWFAMIRQMIVLIVITVCTAMWWQYQVRMCWCNRPQTGTAALVRLFGQARVHEIVPSQKRKTCNSGDKLLGIIMKNERRCNSWRLLEICMQHGCSTGELLAAEENEGTGSTLARQMTVRSLGQLPAGNDQHRQGLWFLNQAISHEKTLFLNKAINHKQEQIFHQSAAMPGQFKRKMFIVFTCLEF